MQPLTVSRVSEHALTVLQAVHTFGPLSAQARAAPSQNEEVFHGRWQGIRRDVRG
jgi:hypothetical protein